MKRERLSKLLVGIGLVVVIAVALPLMGGCLPTPEEVAAPDAYEEYVAGLPEGCFPAPRDVFEQAIEEGQLNIYDWADWWPEEIYANFEEEFGIKIARDYFATTDEMVTKFKLYPEVEYDYVLPDLSAFLRLKELDVLQQINHDWIPNVNEYLPEATKNAEYDPGYKYSVASDTGVTAYSYNIDYVDDSRIPSWSVIFEPDEKYKGRMTVLDDMYEVIGCALKYLGYSWSSDDEAELMEAKELLLRQKPYVMAYDSYPKRLQSEGEVWMSQQWNGGIYFNQRYVEGLRCALPAEGSAIMVDPIVIPIGASHPAAAHLFLNYLWRPEVYASLVETIFYLPPQHTAVSEFLSEYAKATAPPEEYLAKCEYPSGTAYSGKGLELRTAIWEELKR